MREVMTKSMARNIFYGGSLFFIIIFVGLTAHSHYYITQVSTDEATLTPKWPQANCFGKGIPASTAIPFWAKAPISHPNWPM